MEANGLVKGVTLPWDFHRPLTTGMARGGVVSLPSESFHYCLPVWATLLPPWVYPSFYCLLWKSTPNHALLSYPREISTAPVSALERVGHASRAVSTSSGGPVRKQNTGDNCLIGKKAWFMASEVSLMPHGFGPVVR